MIQSGVWAVERHNGFPIRDTSIESRQIVISQWPSICSSSPLFLFTIMIFIFLSTLQHANVLK